MSKIKEWADLPMSTRANYIRQAVAHGLKSIDDIKKSYNEFAELQLLESLYSARNLTDALWENAKAEESYGDPTSHYLNTISEEDADRLGYYKDERGHRDDRVKLESHPSHPSRGAWNSFYEFELSDKGIENPNYTLFGLADGNDPQAKLVYRGSTVLPELTVSPQGNYYNNTYDNVKLKFDLGGDKNTKQGPTYDPKTKTWTNYKGLDITGKSFKGKWGTTTYLDSGAVDLDASEVSGNYDDHRWRYAENAPRVYIGGTSNEARLKYFDLDTELTNTILSVAERYGINPNVLASRIAKEGPIDNAIKNYNNTNGYFQRGNMVGPIWGLDDMGSWITLGVVKQPSNIKELFTDVEMENEKGRTTYSVESDNYFDGIELTALALKHFKDEMRKRFPNADDDLLELYATAAFNTGITGATKLIKAGKLKDAYKPFIKLKSKGGKLFKYAGDLNEKDEPLDIKLSDWMMRLLSLDYSDDKSDVMYHGGLPQRTYLSLKNNQRKALLDSGLYIEGTPGDYGLVSKAVGDRDIPVYQRAEDAIDRENLVPIGNTNTKYWGPENTRLIHAGSFPTAVYVDPFSINQNIDFEKGTSDSPIYYLKAWDLNDYGGKGGSTSNIFGSALDLIGNPIVLTTGYLPVEDSEMSMPNFEGGTVKDSIQKMLDETMASKGFVKHFIRDPKELEEQVVDLDGNPVYFDDGTPLLKHNPLYWEPTNFYYGLPEVTVTADKKSNGGNLFADAGLMDVEKDDSSIGIKAGENGSYIVPNSWLKFDPETGYHDVYNNGEYLGYAPLLFDEATATGHQLTPEEKLDILNFRIEHGGLYPSLWLLLFWQEQQNKSYLNEAGAKPVLGPTEALVTAPILAATGAFGETTSLLGNALDSATMPVYNWAVANPITTSTLAAIPESYFIADVADRRLLKGEHPVYGEGNTIWDSYVAPGLLDAMDATIGLGAVTKVPKVAEGVGTVLREGYDAAKQGLKLAKDEFPYVLRPEYNDRSFIRLVGDDAIADMKATGQMRTSEAVFNELYQKLVDEVGLEKADEIAFPNIFDLEANTVYNGYDFSPKTFNRNMFYTGRPFYGPKRTNYIITEPRPITKLKELTNQGLEWIEDGHKGHTTLAKRAAKEAGLNPDEAVGRIVDPVYNGDTNIIPISEMGPFTLYEPAELLGFKMPWYKRTRYNTTLDAKPNVGEGTVLRPTVGTAQEQPTNLLIGNDPKVTTPQWQLESLPGYLIKSLMADSKLGKLVSKQGTISLKNVEAWVNKADTPAIDKELLSKVLEAHKGEKNIDYNTLRREVQELIPLYNRVPLTEYEDYGVERLGFNLKTIGENELPGLPNTITLGQPIEYISPGTKADNINLNTFTFESSGFTGNTKHYKGNPVGHSRTYTTADEPDVLHVMESQSDWALNYSRNSMGSHADVSAVLALEAWNDAILMYKTLKTDAVGNAINDLWLIDMGHGLGASDVEINLILGKTSSRIEEHLVKSYLSRQIQENLKYAAENGLTKMRYPTPETAAKIEGYSTTRTPFRNGEELNPMDFHEQYNPDTYDFENYVYPEDVEVRNIYRPEHQTILKKYADFPRLYLKLFKGQEVRTVTDAKGNTWYEVDVPLSYLDGNAEMQFAFGGLLMPTTAVGLGLSNTSNEQ